MTSQIALGEYLMLPNGMCMYATFSALKVRKKQFNAGIYQVPDKVWFNQVQITDVPKPVPVHWWPDHTITTSNHINYVLYMSSKFCKRLPSNLRPITHECMHLVTCSHFW